MSAIQSGDAASAQVSLEKLGRGATDISLMPGFAARFAHESGVPGHTTSQEIARFVATFLRIVAERTRVESAG
jgi:hypothetical protein